EDYCIGANRLRGNRRVRGGAVRYRLARQTCDRRAGSIQRDLLLERGECGGVAVFVRWSPRIASVIRRERGDFDGNRQHDHDNLSPSASPDRRGGEQLPSRDQVRIDHLQPTWQREPYRVLQ